MNELTLEWTESGQVRSQRIQPGQPSKHPGTVRIGRDPAQCDIVISDLTVSGLHVEIVFNPGDQQFYVRNLRESNPPLVNQKPLVQGEVPLGYQSTLRLGQVDLRVTRGQSLGMPPTVVNQPAPVSYPAAVNAPLPVVAPAQTPARQPDLTPLEPEGRNPVWIILGVVLLLIGGLVLASSLKDLLPDTKQQQPDNTSPDTSNRPSSPQTSPTQEIAEAPRDRTSEPGQLGQLELYNHETGLFQLQVPQAWQQAVNAQEPDYVTTLWLTGDQRDRAGVAVFVTMGDDQLSADELAEVGEAYIRGFVESWQGKNADLTLKQQSPQSDGTVGILWNLQHNAASWVGGTYTNQAGNKIYNLTLFYPREQFDDQVNAEFTEIINSFQVDTSVPIQ